MRLEDNVDPPESALARCGKRGTYLRGMMAVVVDHGHAVDAALELEAAIDTVEFRQPLTNFVDWNVEPEADCDGGGGVAHIVLARHV